MSRTRTILAFMLLSFPVCARAQASPADSAAIDAPPPASAIASTPADFPRGRISGLAFGDVYYDVAGDPRHLYNAAGADQGQANIDGKKVIGKDLNGVQLRRVYFQLDNDLTPRIATRFRLEVDGRELTSGGKLAPYLKNAYVQAKSVIPRGDFFFGEVSTPVFEVPEAFWGYRSVEKLIADFWGLRPSSDLGIELKGYADPSHRFGYSALVSDGSGQKPETDRFKTFALSLPVKLGDLRVEPYVDYQPVRVNPNASAVSDTAANNDQALYRLFAGYEFRRWALGGEAFTRLKHGGAKANTEARGVSVFARGSMSTTLAAFARFDEFRPDTRAANRVDVQLWIGGVDWQPIKDFHVMPNVEATQYVRRGNAVVPPHHDLQARVTFYYLFSRPQS